MVNEYSFDYLISIDDACSDLHCGRTTVYNLLRSGELKGFRINRRWKIPKESIQQFIIKQTHDNTTSKLKAS